MMPRTCLALLAALLCLVASHAFCPVPPPARLTTALHCICIDCARVTNCAAYHFVESKHEQPHINPHPTFEPVNGSPTIHVNVRTIRSPEDAQAEADRMWREYQQQEEEAATADGHDKTVYDFSPTTTMEYDVVACE